MPLTVANLVWENDGAGAEKLIFATADETAAGRVAALVDLVHGARVQKVRVDDRPVEDILDDYQRYIAEIADDTDDLRVADDLRARAASI